MADIKTEIPKKTRYRISSAPSNLITGASRKMKEIGDSESYKLASKYIGNPASSVIYGAVTMPKKAIVEGSKIMKPTSNALLKQIGILETIPIFYKLAFLVLFYFFFYRIFFDIGLFFGINQHALIIYLVWFAIFILFISFIPINRSKLHP